MPIAMICCSICDPSLTREYPKNYIFLAIFTLCFGLLVGCSCAQYKTASVVMAAGLTAVITFGLTLFAMQTKYDFSGFGPYLFAMLLVGRWWFFPMVPVTLN